MSETTPENETRTADLLVRLARALHVYGLPSHRLEEVIDSLARDLDCPAEILVTPTAIVCSVEGETRLERIDEGETQLERLGDLHDVASAVRSGEITVDEASRRVAEIEQQPERYGVLATVAAFGGTSASAAFFFGGGWREAVTAGLIGLVIGAMAIVSGSKTRIARLLPTASAFFAVVLAHFSATQLEPSLPLLSTLAGLIVLIPGLRLTIAMNELAHNHLVSGTARLTGASTTFLQLGFGAAIGWHVAPQWFGAVAEANPIAMPDWVTWLTMPVIALTFVVLFRAAPRDYFAILLGAIASYAGARYGSEALGPEIGMAFGAWGLGTVSTALARIRKRPTAVVLVPGLLLLVPGALGIRTLQALVANDVTLGVETFFSMVMIAIALVTGLFLANLTIRPRAL